MIRRVFSRPRALRRASNEGHDASIVHIPMNEWTIFQFDQIKKLRIKCSTQLLTNQVSILYRTRSII